MKNEEYGMFLEWALLSQTQAQQNRDILENIQQANRIPRLNTQICNTINTLDSRNWGTVSSVNAASHVIIHEALELRGEAIRRHRLMRNWIADETEKTGETITKKDAFEHFGWDRSKVLSSCWCCEWAYWERNLDLYKDNFKSVCFYCPLDWSNGEKEILKATCSTITSNDGHTKDGLYDQWCFETSLLGDPIEASKLARIIANLPEKKEVKEHD